MTIAELMRALDPLDASMEVGVRIGSVTKPLTKVSYESTNGDARLELTASEPMRRRKRKAAAQAVEATDAQPS